MTGEWAPDIDEITDAQTAQRVKEGRSGTAQLDRLASPTLLDEYGLYPRRLQLITEGPSDDRFIAEFLMARYSLDYPATWVPRDTARRRLPTHAGRGPPTRRPGCANAHMLVVDDERPARELVNELRRAGVLGELGEWALKKNLEADNFELDEVCDVVEEYVRERHDFQEFTLDREAPRARVREESAKKNGRAMTSLIVDAAEHANAPIGKREIAGVRADPVRPHHSSSHRQATARRTQKASSGQLARILSRIATSLPR